MRIAFDAKRAFCNTTGLGNYSRGVIEGLARFKPDSSLYLFSPFKKLGHLDSLLEEKKESIQLKSPTIWTPWWRHYSTAVLSQKLEIDIFHGLSHEIPFHLKNKGIKSIVTMHDLIFLRFPHLFKWVDRKLYDLKFRSSCERADKIVAITEQTAKDIVSYYNIDPQKIHVIYQSIAEVFFDQWSDQQKKELAQRYKLPSNYLLYVGTIEERKNLALIIKALSLKPEFFPPLVVIGRSRSYIKEIKKMVLDLHLEDKVIFLGGVAFKDLAGFYQMASLFIFPSFFEGFGLPIVEALASRVPVITSKGSCFPEAGGATTCYIDPYSKEELFSAMSHLLHDSEAREKAISGGLIHAENFRPKNSIERLWELYQIVQKL